MSDQVHTTESKGRLNDLPRWTLKELVSRYGPSLTEEPRRCEGLLRDYCGTFRREIHVLIAALKERVAIDLAASRLQLPRDVLLARLVRRLQDNLGLAEDVALWAVQSWAVALSVISADELIKVPVRSEEKEVVSTEGAATGASVDGQAKGTPQLHSDPLVCRHFASLLSKGQCLLDAAISDRSLEERYGCAEEALQVFSEALALIPGSQLAINASDQALTLVADLAAKCGERAYLNRCFGVAARYLGRTMEIEPGNSLLATRLTGIISERDRLLSEIRVAMERGQPKVSERLAKQMQVMFPDDPEVESLVVESERRVTFVTTALSTKIPELESNKKYCELSRLIEDLETSGIRIHGLADYKERIQQLMQSVESLLGLANKHLKQHEYAEAAAGAAAALDLVADHSEAQKIQSHAEKSLLVIVRTMDDAQAAAATGRWYKAAHLLLSLPNGPESSQSLCQLRSQIRDMVSLADDGRRLLVMTLAGAVIWLLTGAAAKIATVGITAALQGSPMPLASTGSVGICSGLVVQMSLAVLMLPFVAAALGGRATFLSVGPSLATVCVSAGLLFLAAWLSNLVPADYVGLVSLLILALYGVQITALLHLLARRILHNPRIHGFLRAVPVATFVVTALTLAQAMSDVWVRQLAPCFVFCGMVSVAGVVCGWMCWSLIPFAVLLACGLEFGSQYSGLEIWPSIWSWTGALLSAAMLLLLLAHNIRWPTVAIILFCAAIATLLVTVSERVQTIPNVKSLLSVWFVYWGTLGAVHGPRLSPFIQLADRLRLWRAARYTTLAEGVDNRSVV